MENQKQFQKLLKSVYRQLWKQSLIKETQVFLTAAGVYTLLLLLVARIIIFPYLFQWLLVGLLLMLGVNVYRVRKNKPSIIEAARVYDDYVNDNRVTTSLSFLGDVGILQNLLLSETVSLMKKVQSLVLKRKMVLYDPKYILSATLLFSMALGLYLFPNENMHAAKKQEAEEKMVKEAEKRLKKLAVKQKNPEVQKALEKAIAKLEKKESAKEALKELEKQSKQLQLKQIKKKEEMDKLQEWQKQIDDAGLSNLANALKSADGKEIEKQLEKLNKKWDSLSKEQQNALSKLTQQTKPLSAEEIAKIAQQINKALQSEQELKNLASANSLLQQEAENMLKQMGDTGQLALNPSASPASPSGQVPAPSTGTPSQPNGSTTSGSKSQGSSGKSQGQGQGKTGSGAGNGSSNGSGSGSGSGNGSGSGRGSGSGGSGAGTGAGSRELLTLPSNVDGKNNVESDSGQLGEGSSEQSEGNGPVLRGQIRSYKEVYGQYEEAYRKNTDRVKLPSDLEAIVKNYFSNINPDKE